MFSVFCSAFFSISEGNLIKYSTVVSILMVFPDFALKHAVTVMLNSYNIYRLNPERFNATGYWDGPIKEMGLKTYFTYMPLVTIALMVGKRVFWFCFVFLLNSYV